MDRRALAQELGVGHDDHVVAAEHPLDRPGRADGDRGLVDDDGLGRQDRADLAGRGLDVGQVGRAVLALRRGHAQVGELGVLGGVLGAEDEAEPPELEVLGHDGVEPGLDDRYLALGQGRDPPLVDIGTDDVVPEV